MGLKNKKRLLTSDIKYWGFIGKPGASLAGKLLYQLIGKCSRTTQHSIPRSLSASLKAEQSINSLNFWTFQQTNFGLYSKPFCFLYADLCIRI